MRDVADLAHGLGAAYDRRYLEMVLDGLVGLGEPLVLGRLEGRYPEIDPIVDLLLGYLRAALPELLDRLERRSAGPHPPSKARGRASGPRPAGPTRRPQRRP